MGDLGEVGKQTILLPPKPKSGGDGLAGGVVGQDHAHQLIDIVMLERPGDGCGTGFRGVAPAPVRGMQGPADLKARPSGTFGAMRPRPPNQFAGCGQLNPPLTGVAQRPLSVPERQLLPGLVTVEGGGKVERRPHFRGVVDREVRLKIIVPKGPKGETVRFDGGACEHGGQCCRMLGGPIPFSSMSRRQGRRPRDEPAGPSCRTCRLRFSGPRR